VRHGTGDQVSTALPAREAVAAPPRPTAGVEAPLALAALVTSAAALVVLAGTPAAGTTTGDVVRTLVLLSYWLVAPGAVVVARLRLPASVKVATTPLVGLALLVALGTAGAWTGMWIPSASAAVVAAATLAAAVAVLLRGRRRSGGLPLPRARRGDLLLVLALAAAVGLWVVSLPAIEAAPSSVLGLLVAGPWTFPAAILGTVAVLLVALRTRSVVVLASSVVALVLVLRTTAAVASAVPISAWTYKHIGVVQALQETHHVASGADVYMNWPGMFAAAAYLGDTSGVAIIDLARWTTPVIHVLLAVEAAALARALGARAAGCAAAAVLMVAFNWVGQDYFSPQALAMVLAAGIVVLLLRSAQSRAAAVLVLGLFPAVVVSHQLTPFWLLALAVVLVVLRRVPWWLAGVMGLVLAGFLLSRLQVAEAYGLFSGFDPLENAGSSVPPVPALGREVGGLLARTSSLLVWAATLVVLGIRAARLDRRRGWRSPEVLVPAAIAFSPFLLLAGQSYGGEATLRVTLYSTLGCSAVLGPALVSALRRRALVATAAAAWLVVTVAATAGSAYTLWSINLIRTEDVAAARWLAEEHPDAEVIPLINVWPGRTSVDYLRFIGPLTRLEPGLDEILRSEADLEPEASVPLSPQTVARIAQGDPGETTFVVATATMRDYDAYYATYGPGEYAATLRALATSPDWQVVRTDGDLQVFQYRGVLQ
jgi:hypothetical protein